MKKLFLYLLCCLCIVSYSFGQEVPTDELKQMVFSDFSKTDSRSLDALSGSTLNSMKKAPTIEGNVFLVDTFAAVEIYGNEGQTFKTKGRYNIEADELQFFDKQKKVKAIQPSKIKGFMMNNKVFIAKKNNDESYAFYEILAHGELQLLVKRNITLVTTNDNPLLGSSTGDKKAIIAEKIYYADSDGVKKLSKSKKKILKLMNKQEEAISTTIKENRLNTKRKRDLTVIFSFYNTLQESQKKED